MFGIGEFEVSTQKSERIENYAIRLAEIVNDVKQRTGSNTVTIVAHSMGGLVAREYVALFGEGSLNKLITINTPHQGITGKVESFCNVFGSHKECEDMSEGSIFLKRLNARSTPSNTFVIRSTGCKMGDEFGDGVVTQENGKLKDSTDFLFEGKCTDSLKTDLHGKLLDPDLHPEVYEKLVEILT